MCGYYDFMICEIQGGESENERVTPQKPLGTWNLPRFSLLSFYLISSPSISSPSISSLLLLSHLLSFYLLSSPSISSSLLLSPLLSFIFMPPPFFSFLPFSHGGSTRYRHIFLTFLFAPLYYYSTNQVIFVDELREWRREH